MRPLPDGAYIDGETYDKMPPFDSEDWSLSSAYLSTWVSRAGVDMMVSSVESLLIGLEQRELDTDQIDRLARVLQGGELHLLARLKRRRRRRRVV